MIKNIKKTITKGLKTIALMSLTIVATIFVTRYATNSLGIVGKLIATDICLLAISFIGFYRYIKEKIRIFQLISFLVFSISLAVHVYFLWEILSQIIYNNY